MTTRFELITTSSSRLWDFGWFDLSRFRVEIASPEQDDWPGVLRAFLADPISQRRFCTQPDPWGAVCGHHGPFRAETMAAEWFRPIARGELGLRMGTAFEEGKFDGPPSAEQQRPIWAWAEDVESRGDRAFELAAPLDVGVRVEFADMVWFVFREYVAVAANGREFSIAVIGYD